MSAGGRWVGRLALAVGLALASACGGGVIQRVDALPEPPPGVVFLQITCDPNDVDVLIDGQFEGLLTGYRAGVLRVAPGTHRVTLRKAGFYPFHELVDAKAGTLTLQTHLVRRP